MHVLLPEQVIPLSHELRTPLSSILGVDPLLRGTHSLSFEAAGESDEGGGNQDT